MVRLAAGVWIALAAAPLTSQAGLPRFCDQPAALTAAQQARLLRVSAVVKDVLERSGQSVALVSRTGPRSDRPALLAQRLHATP